MGVMSNANNVPVAAARAYISVSPVRATTRGKVRALQAQLRAADGSLLGLSPVVPVVGDDSVAEWRAAAKATQAARAIADKLGVEVSP